MDILDAIKATLYIKGFTITVEEDVAQIIEEMITVLDKKVMEDDVIYLNAEQSVNQL